MKALVYHGPGKIQWEEKAKPTLQKNTDVVLKVLKTTICGTDLHILKGDVPTVEAGRTLGHEGVGIVTAVGEAVTNFEVGDHVVISCITSCGKCENCKQGMLSHCADGGWILGNTIDGTQAGFVRIPHADNSLYLIPLEADEEAMVMLSDVLPTAFECGVLNGKIKPGDIVAIVGAGPIGLAVLLTAQFYTPSMLIVIDRDDNRLSVARSYGATHVIDSRIESAFTEVLKLTKGKGVDVAVEAVGIAATFEFCEEIIAAGGHIANIGVHGNSAILKLESLWSRNITITTGLVDASSTSTLLDLVQAGKLDPQKLITHRFGLDQIIEAYSAFGDASTQKALK
ncbi:MAG TPA: zinc-dependent alcohol dehydrogenase family protein, partial [Bacteroidia bacterium]|nr:zinc-dependent alcohol dehydrogenase family protein [Bacteroidia bacterium]